MSLLNQSTLHFNAFNKIHNHIVVGEACHTKSKRIHLLSLKLTSMNSPKCLPLLFLLFVFISTGCNKNDDDSSDSASTKTFNTEVVTGNKGCYFEITRNGETESCTSDNMWGWEKGMLLNSSYFRQVRTGCDGYSFRLQISIPHDVSFLDMGEGVHQLSPYAMPLENTASLNEVHVEFAEIIGPFATIEGSSTGTVDLRRDISVQDITYSLIGEVDATFYNDGSEVKVKGMFWNKTTDW